MTATSELPPGNDQGAPVDEPVPQARETDDLCPPGFVPEPEQ